MDKRHFEQRAEKQEVVLGLVGYGYWGPNLARNFLDLEGARVKYICDSSPEKLEDAGRACPASSSSPTRPY